MGKKRKLRKLMRKRELQDETALVICVGKRCCDRDESRDVVEAAREHAQTTHAHARVITVGCLGVCKKGPIAATYPGMKFRKHVTRKRARKLLDKLERQLTRRS
jgi:(2Fe-2S) ferredoxin